jgi:hypothetical protein
MGNAIATANMNPQARAWKIHLFGEKQGEAL